MSKLVWIRKTLFGYDVIDKPYGDQRNHFLNISEIWEEFQAVSTSAPVSEDIEKTGVCPSCAEEFTLDQFKLCKSTLIDELVSLRKALSLRTPEPSEAEKLAKREGFELAMDYFYRNGQGHTLYGLNVEAIRLGILSKENE